MGRHGGAVSGDRLAVTLDVPEGTSAAMINLTAVDADGPGYLTLEDCEARSGERTTSALTFQRGDAVAATAIVALVGWHLGASPWFFVALVGLFALCLIGFFQYRFHTSPQTAKRMETYAGLYIIAFDLILAFELIRSHGVQLSWT